MQGASENGWDVQPTGRGREEIIAKGGECAQKAQSSRQGEQRHLGGALELDGGVELEDDDVVSGAAIGERKGNC